MQQISRPESVERATSEQSLPTFPAVAKQLTDTGGLRAPAARFSSVCGERAPEVTGENLSGTVKEETELLRLGPLEPLLQDDTVSEIMVNGPGQVWIERGGVIQATDIHFDSDEEVKQLIDRIAAHVGRRCDSHSPMVDARLPNGSRVNAIIPPLSLSGPILTVRKFATDPFTMQNLIEFGTVTAEVAEFLAGCVKGRLNIIISGGTGTGKTTLLNVMSAYIPESERIITIEDAAELQLRQKHVIRLEKRPANLEGDDEVTARDLVVNALRMRPDRIIVGECRASEALDMLQAMNTGHEGSLTSVHANSPRDALARIETMVLMAGVDLPLRAIREQIASAINLIVQLERVQGGARKVIKISELQGMEGDLVVMQDVFAFHQTGIVDNKVQGKLLPLGIRPKLTEKLDMAGVHLPVSVFEKHGVGF